MKKYLLATALFISFSSMAVSNNCKIASQMFDDSGELIILATNKAKGEGVKKLSQSKISFADYSKWDAATFTPKMLKLINKYSNYQNVDANNPIYLGNVSIIETSTYSEALKMYMNSKEEKYLLSMRETMNRIGKAYDALKENCTK